MRKQFFTFGSALLLAVLGGACSSAAAGLVELGPEDNGSSVILPAGDNLSITLEGNLTTGYSWEADPLPDPAVLELVEEPSYESSSKALGAGGKFTFTYRAAGEGQTNLRLIYHRPFEPDVPPLEVYELTVRVTQ